MPKNQQNRLGKIKPIGEVTHYFGGIGVAIIKFNKTVKVGETIKFKGASTDFEEVIESIQYNHKDIKSAKKIKKWESRLRKKHGRGTKSTPLDNNLNEFNF